MPVQTYVARQSDEGGVTSGHVSGRIISGTTPVAGPPDDAERSTRRRPTEYHASRSGPPQVTVSAGSSASRGAPASSGAVLSSLDSYEAAAPRRRSQPINAELVKLVASFAPLELAQLKAMEQKARLKKAQAPAAAVEPEVPVRVMGIKTDAMADTQPQHGPEPADSSPVAEMARVEQPPEAARLLVRPSTADASRGPGRPVSAPVGRARSQSAARPQSATRPTHLAAAPPKGAVVKRDLNILPNPVAQKQTEVIQRQAAVSAFVKRLQREQDLLRAEKERRLKAEQEALAAALEEDIEARAAEAEVTRVPEAQPVPIRRKKPAPPSSGANTALKDIQAPEKKPADAKPWRRNMRRQKNPPVTGDAPVGAPREVPAKAATGVPPPRNVSPNAAAARAKVLDPVACVQVKEYMDRKAKEMAAKQQQERAAQLEAKTAHLKVLKAEMLKARERAQKYADAAKEKPPDFKGPRPAWVDIAPADGGSAPVVPSRVATSQRLFAGASSPDHDLMSERPMPYHMSDAMRMEAAERRRQERLAASPHRSQGGLAVLVDNYGHPVGGDGWNSGPEVVRVHDPEIPQQGVRAQRASSARLALPVAQLAAAPTLAAARQLQVGQPIAPETLRAIDIETRIAARKQYEQHQRELQAAERRDSSRGRDTSRGRDNSRGRRRSPTAGRKHEATSLNSRSRSPPKWPKQQVRRSRSASRAMSANRRMHSAPALPSSTGPRDASQPMLSEYPTAAQAELQQARNERHVGDLWELALQLSERLGALQQQGFLAAPQQPVQAWPEPRAQVEQQQAASLRGSLAGPLLPYLHPVAIVPTGLPSGFEPAHQVRPVPRHTQYDEAVEADIEFQTEVSWPVAVHKKPRTTGGNSSTGLHADSSIGFGARMNIDPRGSQSSGPASVSGGGSSLGGQRHEDAYSASGSDNGETTALDDNVSTLTSGLCATSVAVGPAPSILANLSSGPSQGCLSAYSRDQDAPSLHGKSDLPSPAQRTRSTTEGGRPSRATSSLQGDFQPSAPSSPNRQVPAAPIIQIPLPPASAQPAVDALQPAVSGLPYDNATFSAESADEDGSSSGAESTYGQRVLSITELHDMLEENPQLAQRLSLDRERDRWEYDGESQLRGSGGLRRSQQSAGDRTGGAMDWKRMAPPSPSPGGSSNDSDPGTPARRCDEIMYEYEQANSPLRLRLAQRELLKAQAAKRAPERLEPFDFETYPSETEEASEDLDVIQLPKSGDPMSIISLIAHKGRLPARPTIIQLSEPPVLDGRSLALEEPNLAAQAHAGGDAVVQERSARPASEVLLIPGSKGPQLIFTHGLLQPDQPQELQQPQLLQHKHPQQQQAGFTVSPRRVATKDTGIGEGRVDYEEPNGSSSQQLTDSLPPFVIVASMSTSAVAPVVQPSPNSALLGTGRNVPVSPSARSPAAPAASMQQQVDAIRSLHQQHLDERGLSESSARTERKRHSGGGAAQSASEGLADGGGSVLGAMASPPPRQRVVTFLDEAQGPPERVRLAPSELFHQMQTTLKTYEELDAAELELQQVQNARAIAAVQREAHRIAQRLDQTAAAEAQQQLIAQTQARMDAKLHAFEETIRDEIRKDSLGHLHDVTSLFVEQLSRNKVVHKHSTAQTVSSPPSPPRPEFGVQVGPPLTQQPVSILRSSSPHQQHQQRSSRSPSPVHLPQTSFRPTSPSLGAPAYSQQPFAPQREGSPSRGGSPGPGGRTNGVSFQRPPSESSNRTADYTEDFEGSDLRQNSYISGRSPSRVSFRQASHMSVPEEMEEEKGSSGGSESESAIEEILSSRRASREASVRSATSTTIPESVLDFRDRQASRTSLRQTSFASVPAESIASERSASGLGLRHQTSTLSVPQSVSEEPASGLGRSRSVLRQQQSTVSSVGFASAAASTHVGHRSSGGGAESVPYSLAGGDIQAYSSIQESLAARQSARLLSGISRHHSAIDEDIRSEPTYSTAFEKDEEENLTEEEIASRSRTVTQTMQVDDYSADDVGSEPSGRRAGQGNRAATTTSARSEVEEVIRTISGGRSRSYSPDNVEEDSSVAGLGSSPQPQPSRSPLPGGFTAAGARDTYRREDMAGVMTTPWTARTESRRDDARGPAASPLNLRASIDGGLELDDDLMASYAADSESRMRQEVALLQDRLQDINRRMEAKMDKLELELAAETQPQKRQALIRAQRLLQVQHDADAADIQRQISAVKADFSRQRLMLERLYRLAQLTSPGAALAAKHAPGHAPVLGGGRAERGRGGSAALEQRGSEQARPVSGSRSVEEVAAQQLMPSGTGSIGEEGSSARRLACLTTSSIREEPLRHTRRSTISGAVDEDIQKGSGSTAVVEEYSDQFEPSRSESQLFPASHRPTRPTRQRSSIVDDVEESISGRRLGVPATQSQSVVAEDNFQRSSSTATKSRRPASGSVATEAGYTEDFHASGGSAKAAPRARPEQRPGSSSARSYEMDSELSVLSMKLEREKAELACKLREAEQLRRAKIQRKEVEIARMRAKLAALTGTTPAAPVAKPARRKPPSETDYSSDSSVEEDPAVAESGSRPPSTGADEVSQVDTQSVEDMDVAEESEIDEEEGEVYGTTRQSSLRGRQDATVSTSRDAPMSTTRSSDATDPDVAAIEKEVAILKEKVRLARQARVEAAQRQKAKLEAELKSLMSGQPLLRTSDLPPPGASEPRRGAATAAHAGQSQGTFGSCSSYSQEFTTSGSVSAPSARGDKSSSSVIDELAQSPLHRQPASGSQSKSISEERNSSLQPMSRGTGSRGSSVIGDETHCNDLLSSGAEAAGGDVCRGAGLAITASDVYESSFETDSARGGSALRGSSDIQDEAGPSDVASSGDPTAGVLEPIREEDARSVSAYSISCAADSVHGQSLRESVADQGSDTVFSGFPTPSGVNRSVEESGDGMKYAADPGQAGASGSVEDDMHVTVQGSIAPERSAASQSVRDEQELSVEGPGAQTASSGTSSIEFDVQQYTRSQSGSGSRSKDSKEGPSALSEEFFTTADINTHSATPSIHSMEVEATRASSAPATATRSRSALSREATLPVAEFLTSGDTDGESAAPSVHSADLEAVQESSLQEEAFMEGSAAEELDEDAPFVVTQRSSSSSSSVAEEGRGGPPTGSRSAEILDDSLLPVEEGVKAGTSSQSVAQKSDEEEEEAEEVSGLEVDYSEFEQDTADIEVEAPEKEGKEEEDLRSALHSRGWAGLEQTSSVAEEAAGKEYSELSARDATAQDSILEAVDVDRTDDLEETRAAKSAGISDDIAMQRYTATASASADVVDDGMAQHSTTTASAAASEVPVQRSAAAPSITASAMLEELSQEVEDYELDFQPSVLEAQESSREVLGRTGETVPASPLVSTAGAVEESDVEEPEDEEPKEGEDDYELDFQPSALEVESSSRKALQPSGATASASRLMSTGEIVQEEEKGTEEDNGDDLDQYELDFSPSALELPGEESSRKVLEPPAHLASASRLEVAQDALELFSQTSLREVASLTSVGSRRLPVMSQGSSKAVPSLLQQQASSVSAATYDEDFEEGDVSDLQPQGPAGVMQTTLSVVDEEDEPRPQADATGSKLYSEDFAPASTFKPAEELPPEVPDAQQQRLAAVGSAIESAASEVEAEDLEYEYEDDLEPEEDEQPFSAGSGRLVGPVLPPAATTSVGLEVSMRYGPASDRSSTGYSDDFQDKPGGDKLLASAAEERAGGVATVEPTSSLAMARETDRDLQPLMSEPRSEASAHRLASQASADRRVPAPALAVATPQEPPPPPIAAEPSAAISKALPEREADDSMSVLSVEEEGLASATVSSEPSAQELPRKARQSASKAKLPAPGVSGSGSGSAAANLGDDDGDGDDYTRDFADVHSNLEAQSSSNVVPQSAKESAVASHPISQPPSPPARSEASVISGADDREAEWEGEPEEDLDVSNLGLDSPLAAKLGGAAAEDAAAGASRGAQPPASESPALAQVVGAEEAPNSMASEMEGEESGIIAVPRGMGIRQTRRIESRTWRNQQAMFLEEDEGGLSGDVDLVDMSMPGGEGSGLLDMLGADLITDASEANTPSHSFRIRSGDLASAPSSGSPFGVRSALSVRLATLRESLDHEGEDATASSEGVSPSAARVLHRSSEGVYGGQQSRTAQEDMADRGADSGKEMVAEEVFDEESTLSRASSDHGGSGQRSPQKAAAPSLAEHPGEPVPARSGPEAVAVTGKPLQEPFRAAEVEASAAAAPVQPTREASGGSSSRYSDNLEAPPGERSAGGQSAEEYDPYMSAALAEDDSDELRGMAAAFESQGLGADDDDEDGGVAAEYSGISASGLSDDLTKYKVAVQADSDEEAGDSSRAAPAPIAPPAPTERLAALSAAAEEAEDLPSEVVDEEPEAAASDPFSVDESADRLPTFPPVAPVQPPASLLSSAAQLPVPAAVQPPASLLSSAAQLPVPAAAVRVDEPKVESTVKPAFLTVVAAATKPAAAAPSPTVSSPRSELSSRDALPDETSLGPLPRSGLGGDDEEDEQGLEYRAVYKPHVEESFISVPPGAADTQPAAGPRPDDEGVTAEAAEDGSGPKGGFLQKLKEMVLSDDDEDLTGSFGGRAHSAGSLKPMFQALLDQPETEGDLPKGEFESEIEEMLLASRSRSRLVSPHQSRDWTLDSDAAQEQDGNTPISSARGSLVGFLPAPSQPQPRAAAAVVVSESTSQELPQERAAPAEPAAKPARDAMVDEITESTVKELVADAVEVMVGAAGQAELPIQSAATTAIAAQDEPKVPAGEELEEGQPAEKSARVPMAGETSISMSVDELEGDIELDAEIVMDSGGPLDLPSPIPSDSGSVGSPLRSYVTGAATQSDDAGASPTLGPERSDRDLARSGSVPDEGLGDSGIGLTSDEDLGWGGADLDDDWQPDVSGLIAPEMDQAAIERENAPAVAIGAAEIVDYAGQVLEQFMDNRPEFLAPGAEPLSLEGFLDQERRLVHASEAQHIHNKMVYDATNEALLAIYRAANRAESQPWLCRNRIAKPLPSPAEMAKQVQQRLQSWAAMRMRDATETDKVLAMDAQEDERARGDLGVEEAEVQREVADLLWEDLVEDTARQLMELEQLMTPNTSSTSAGGGMGEGRRHRLDSRAP